MNILINEQCTVEYDEWERGGYLDEMDGIKKCIYISIQVGLSKTTHNCITQQPWLYIKYEPSERIAYTFTVTKIVPVYLKLK